MKVDQKHTSTLYLNNVCSFTIKNMTMQGNFEKFNAGRIGTQVLSHCNVKVTRRYPYFDVVVGFVWSHDSKSYAGGSVCYW
jgi:hypothetical protein